MNDPTPAVPAATVTLLRDWHQAVSAKDVNRVLSLCTPDVELHGPSGTGSGHDLVRDWLSRSGIRLRLRSLTSWHGTFLAEQEATWPLAAGQPAAPAVACVTVFGVRDGKVSSVARYDTVEEAESARV
jgi:SnoaL-like domain